MAAYLRVFGPVVLKTGCILVTWGTFRPWLYPQRFGCIGLELGSFSGTSGDANIWPRLRNLGLGRIETWHRSLSHEVPGEPLLSLAMSIREISTSLVFPGRIDLVFSSFKFMVL